LNMANQMIALQARNPQLADPARVTAQMGQMLNTVAQQRAAERQAQRLAQEMEFARAGEERAVQTQTATMRQKDLDYLKDLTAQYRDRLATINPADKARYGVLRQEIIDNIPAFANELPLPDEWSQNSKVLTIAKADDVIKYSLATPVASLELSQGGMPRSVVVGGLNPEQRPVYDAPEAGAATPTAPATAPAAPQTNPMAAGATPRTADADPGSLGLVIASALETGVMSKSDYDKMISIAQPQSRAKIAAWAQQNNIEIVPNTPGVTDNQMRGAAADFETTPMSYDGQTPESQFAVYRGEPMQSQTAGLGGAPEMRQTLAQARTSTPLQMRNPNVSPLPGSSQVPIERVRAEGVAGRESPAEAAAKATATARATAAVETEKKAAEKAPGRKQVSTIIKKIRGAYEQLEKKEAIASEKRGGFANVMDYLATTSPGREVQKALGTSASKYLSEIVNSRKLLATAIKNATGMSAQEMNSNVELQLTLDALTDPTQGIEAARSTLDTLEELYGAPRTAPAQGARRTPTLQTLTPEQVRANPNIKRWKTTDGRIMTRP
jgi:hypothetical protein